MVSERIPVRVAQIRRETDEVVSLDLVPASGTVLPRFEPGAHIDVELAPGLVRQYSLYGDCADRGAYSIGVLRDRASRGGSLAVHRLKVGDALTIGAPRNLFPLVAEAEHSILLGGGIGITPLLSMAYALARRQAAFDLHYYTRCRAATAFLPLIENAPFAGNVRFHFCEEDPDAGFCAARDLPGAAPGQHLYTCGPEGFMAAVTEGALGRGYPADVLHREHFRALAPEPADRDSDFVVVHAPTGKTYDVPAGRSIAAVLIEAGLDVELSCEQGMCGTCLVDLVEGEADHRDIYQTAAEKAANTRIAICCSRARSDRLVLDF